MLATLRSLAEKTGLTTTRCSVCSALTDDKGWGLCHRCATELAPRIGGFCPQCGELFGDETSTPAICPECRNTPPPWDSLCFHNIYAGRLRELILAYKFHKGFYRARLLADLAHISFTIHGTRIPDVIVPVPLHHRRLAWRGFNQSTELSRVIARRLESPVLKNGLIRTRHTPPQTRLGKKERQENIKNAFATETKKVMDKAILLVDDVYTTGATLRECAGTLKRAGAASVDVLVLARAVN